VTIEIPALDVHSALNEVGLDDSGAIETPSGARYDEAAWYKHSPPPGSIGPAIVLGHVDSAVNGPSVFFRLGELEPGDRVLITRKDGSIARFTVYSVHLYPKDGFPTDVVYGDTDHAALRLITCGGEFDDLSGHYEDNIVVFAKLDPIQTR
jgi:sortase (surface protein transpeptidase)